MKKCLFTKLFNAKLKNEYKYIEDNNELSINKPILKLCIWPYMEKYIDPFDKDLFFNSEMDLQKRHEFLLYCNKKDNIRIGNIQAQEGPERYYITGVNVKGYCRKMGVTNLLFSWVILKLMEENKEQDFSIYIKLGEEIQDIKDKKHKFTYYKIFDENRIHYDEKGNLIVDREFRLYRQEEDKVYFHGLYDDAEENIINNLEEIKHKIDTNDY